MARARRISKRNTPRDGGDEELTEDPQGLKKLSQEADKTLSEKSDKIAGALGNSAVGGDFACAKLLVELAKRKKLKKQRAAEEKPSGSLATRFANEPAWPGAEVNAEKQVKVCSEKR